MREFSAIITGDEVLNCTVKDENGFWLCREMNSMGFSAGELIFLRDDISSISSHMKRLISKDTEIIIVTGGLGPTHDDKTLSAIAEATGRQLKLNDKALEMVKNRYAYLYEKGIMKEKGMNANREKMAIIPDGAVPIRNSVGAAPGIMLRHGKSMTIALPGVPSEMKCMFQEEVKKIIENEFGIWAYAERNILLDYRDESAIAEIVQSIARSHDVYVKSRAGTFESERKMVITLSARAENKDLANEKIDLVMKELFRYLSERGIRFSVH